MRHQQSSRLQLSLDRRQTEWIRGRLRCRDLGICHGTVELHPGQGGICGLADDGQDRPGERAVPVAVERRRQVGHHLPGRQDIHVDEVGLAVLHEVFVGDVAPAIDSHRVVGHEQLVVHAVVVELELARRQQQPQHRHPAPQRHRVEQAHLDVRNGRQAEQQVIDLDGEEVVHQQTNAHAAQRRVTKFPHQRAAGIVAMDVVVLQVQRLLGPTRQCDACLEGKRAIRQQPKARGLHLVRRAAGRRHARQFRARDGGVGEGVRCGQLAARRKGTAGGEPCEKRQNHQTHGPADRRRAA